MKNSNTFNNLPYLSLYQMNVKRVFIDWVLVWPNIFNLQPLQLFRQGSLSLWRYTIWLYIRLFIIAAITHVYGHLWIKLVRNVCNSWMPALFDISTAVSWQRERRDRTLILKYAGQNWWKPIRHSVNFENFTWFYFLFLQPLSIGGTWQCFSIGNCISFSKVIKYFQGRRQFWNHYKSFDIIFLHFTENYLLVPQVKSTKRRREWWLCLDAVLLTTYRSETERGGKGATHFKVCGQTCKRTSPWMHENSSLCLGGQTSHMRLFC